MQLRLDLLRTRRKQATSRVSPKNLDLWKVISAAYDYPGYPITLIPGRAKRVQTRVDASNRGGHEGLNIRIGRHNYRVELNFLVDQLQLKCKQGLWLVPILKGSAQHTSIDPSIFSPEMMFFHPKAWSTLHCSKGAGSRSTAPSMFWMPHASTRRSALDEGRGKTGGVPEPNFERNIGIRHARSSNAATEIWYNRLGFACSFLNAPTSDSLAFYTAEPVITRWTCSGTRRNS